eukprot:1157450-Pelagomonas_calceolata.AAC.3
MGSNMAALHTSSSSGLRTASNSLEGHRQQPHNTEVQQHTKDMRICTVSEGHQRSLTLYHLCSTSQNILCAL